MARQRKGLPGNLGIGIALADDCGEDLHAGARFEARGALGDVAVAGFAEVHRGSLQAEFSGKSSTALNASTAAGTDAGRRRRR